MTADSRGSVFFDRPAAATYEERAEEAQLVGDRREGAGDPNTSESKFSVPMGGNSMRVGRCLPLFCFIAACSTATTSRITTASAEELYLSCEFEHYKCSPSLYRINLQTHRLVAWSCAGSSPDTVGWPALISDEAIVVISTSGPWLSVNRLTGDAVKTGTWHGSCRRVGGWQF